MSNIRCAGFICSWLLLGWSSMLTAQPFQWKRLALPDDSAYQSLRILEQRAQKWTESDLDSVFWYLDQLQSGLQTHEFPSEACEILRRMGRIRGVQGDDSASIALLNQALSCAISSQNPLCECETTRNLADVYAKKKDHFQTLLYLKRILGDPLCREFISIQDQDSLFIQMGKLFTRLANEDFTPKGSKPPSPDSTLFKVIAGLIVLVTLGGYFLYRSIQRKQQTSEEQLSLVQQKLEQIQEKEQGLELELQQKRKQITSLSLNLAQRNQMIKEFKAQLGSLEASSAPEAHALIHQMKRQVEQHVSIDQNWEEFSRQFQAIHKDFLAELKRTYPKLTPGDLRLCALLKLNLSTNEIASLQGIAPHSVRISSYRIRKKMELPKGTKLSEFLISFPQN